MPLTKLMKKYTKKNHEKTGKQWLMKFFPLWILKNEK